MAPQSAPEGSSANPLLLERQGELTIARILVPKLYVSLGAGPVGQQLLEGARKGDFRRLLIDFTQVEVVSSSFLGTLAVLHQTLKKQGGRLRIFGLHETLERVFEVARLRDLFGIDPDEETARFQIERE